MKQDYVACDYTVEGDYSSASYLLSLIAINGGKAKIKNLFRDSKQGDKYILDILQSMGATVIYGEDLRDFRFQIPRPMTSCVIEQDNKILYCNNPN